jgi:hypothetical protein
MLIFKIKIIFSIIVRVISMKNELVYQQKQLSSLLH